MVYNKKTSNKMLHLHAAVAAVAAAALWRCAAFLLHSECHLHLWPSLCSALGRKRRDNSLLRRIVGGRNAQ
jgi:hypothetical protein